MPTASARHILVPTEAECLELKAKLDAGGDFESLAKQHSKCPSGRQGGALGNFGPGQMVKEFDTVVFNEEVGKVHGPVKTQFGYHLLRDHEPLVVEACIDSFRCDEAGEIVEHWDLLQVVPATALHDNGMS